MTFRPHMTCFTHGYELRAPLAYRGWDGIVADYWQVSADVGAGGHYLSPDPRIVVMLSDDPLAISYRADGGSQLAMSGVAYVPAGMPLWSETTKPQVFAHLDLHFQRDSLVRRLGGADLVNQPIFMESAKVKSIAALIAAECTAPEQNDQYLDGLISALLMAVFKPDQTANKTAGLSPAQMRRLIAHVNDNPDSNIANTELAAVVGLSEGWFASAFRKTTGTSPHKWQTGLRIARVMQAMTDAPARSLAQIAVDNGFADQAHMSRTFKTYAGMTPAAWRKDHVSAVN